LVIQEWFLPSLQRGPFFALIDVPIKMPLLMRRGSLFFHLLDESFLANFSNFTRFPHGESSCSVAVNRQLDPRRLKAISFRQQLSHLRTSSYTEFGGTVLQVDVWLLVFSLSNTAERFSDNNTS
jgi:hypothetical protein